MQDNGEIPPMGPDDFAALAAFAGPLYQEARQVERYTSDNPIPGVHTEYGSMIIKQSLEQAKRLAQDSVVRQRPMYVPPSPLEVPDIAIGTASFTPYPTTPQSPVTPTIPLQTPVVPSQPSNEHQLELPFNRGKQDETNDLLREISKKLTKLINILEKPEGHDIKPPKSIPNVKKNTVQ